MKQQEPLFLHNESIIVDNFAGGGGASTGIEAALGIPVDIAINHDVEAVAMHAVNHPRTKHFCEDVWKVNPKEATQGRHVRLAWFSPDCKHFSKAKGGKPVSKKIRGLAWIVVKWAKEVSPDVIMLENVEEFETWGPLLDNGLPDKSKTGFTFRRWWKMLENLGYQVEMKVLRACDYGAPTIRKRLFIVARRDGQAIVWPKPTHSKDGKDGLLPWRTAAECIDWDIPCPSIFERKKPLAENTMKRIARGLQRYVIDANKPFIVGVTHAGGGGVHDIDEPLNTVTGAQRGEKALVTPYIARITQTGSRSKQVHGADEPVSTVTSKAEHILVAPTLVQTGYGEREGQAPRAMNIEAPLGTIVGTGKAALVSAWMMKYNTGAVGKGMDEPFPTVTAGSFLKRPGGNPPLAVATAFLAQHNSQREGVNPGRPVDEPISTLTASGSHQQAVVATLVGVGGRAGQSRPRGADEPAATITAKADSALVTASLVNMKGQSVGQDPEEPLRTITAHAPHHGIVTSHLVKMKGTCKDGQPVDEPLHTVAAGGMHHAEVRAFLIKYFGTDQDPRLEDPLHTVTSKDRFGLVTIHGIDYQIVDIGMRMLTPRELYRAQGFPENYVIDFSVAGKPLTKTAQVRMCGNSVCPPLSEALVRANVRDAIAQRRAA